MWHKRASLVLIATLTLPACASVGVLAIYAMPNPLLTVLALWALGSVPLGVLIGHCALSEE